MRTIVASRSADAAPLIARSANERSRSPRSRVQALVLPVYQEDACGRSREVFVLPASPPRGYSPSEDGPSGPVSRRGVDDLRFKRNRPNIKNILGDGKPAAADPAAANEQNHAAANGEVFQVVSIRASRRITAEPARSPKPPPTKRALCRTRTDDPFLTMTPRGLSGVLRIPIYAENTGVGGLDAGRCEAFRAGCGFQRVSISELPRRRCFTEPGDEQRPRRRVRVAA